MPRFARQDTSRNYGTGTEIVIGAVKAVPVDIDLAVVRAPVDARHAAAAVARTRTEGQIVHVQALFGLVPVLQLVKQAFQQGDALAVLLLELVSREIFVFLVCLLAVADPDSVSAILRVAVVAGDGLVQIVSVPPARNVLCENAVDLVQGQTPGNDDETVKAGLALRNPDVGKIQFDSEVLLVKLGPFLLSLLNSLVSSFASEECLEPALGYPARINLAEKLFQLGRRRAFRGPS